MYRHKTILFSLRSDIVLYVPCHSDLFVHFILKTMFLGLMQLFYDNLDIRDLKVKTDSVTEQIVLLGYCQNRISRLYKVYFY